MKGCEPTAVYYANVAQKISFFSGENGFWIYWPKLNIFAPKNIRSKSVFSDLFQRGGGGLSQSKLLGKNWVIQMFNEWGGGDKIRIISGKKN